MERWNEIKKVEKRGAREAERRGEKKFPLKTRGHHFSVKILSSLFDQTIFEIWTSGIFPDFYFSPNYPVKTGSGT